LDDGKRNTAHKGFSGIDVQYKFMFYLLTYIRFLTELVNKPRWKDTSSWYSSPAFHKCIRWFVVNGRKAGDVADELIEQRGLEKVSFLRDKWLLGQNNFLGSRRVRRQQSPVDVATITQVWVVAVLYQPETNYKLEEEEKFA